MASLSQQLLAEARSLVTRLHDQDKLADSLLAQSHTLHERISCMKEYDDDLREFNESCRQRPRSALVHNLQQENRQIRQLQDENRQLKLALEEHQVALDLIMIRYRQQVLKMVQMNQLETLLKNIAEDPKECKCDKISQMVEFGHVFGSCLKLGEDSSLKDQEELARLQTENMTLRRLLTIAAPNDSQAVKTYANFLRGSQKNDETPSTNKLTETLNINNNFSNNKSSGTGDKS